MSTIYTLEKTFLEFDRILTYELVAKGVYFSVTGFVSESEPEQFPISIGGLQAATTMAPGIFSLDQGAINRITCDSRVLDFLPLVLRVSDLESRLSVYEIAEEFDEDIQDLDLGSLGAQDDWAVEVNGEPWGLLSTRDEERFVPASEFA